MGKGKGGCETTAMTAMGNPVSGAAEAELEQLGKPKRSKARRRPLSAEQRKAKQLEVQARVDEMEQHIQHAVDNPELIEEWMKDLSSGNLWRYSFGNLCLARSQAKGRDMQITRLAGYGKWSEHGYQVKKGERSLQVLAPKTYIRKDKKTGQPLLDKDGNPLRGRYFGSVGVFDISQTEPILDEDGQPTNKDLLSTPESEQAVSELKQIAEEQGIQVFLGGVDDANLEEQAALNIALAARPTASGFFTDLGGKDGDSRPVILTRPGLGSADEARVLAHELAHALMHTDRTGSKDHDDRVRKEAEAESAAYVLASQYGLQTEEQAFYVAQWVGSLDKQLRPQLIEEGLSGAALEAGLRDKKSKVVRDALGNIQTAVRTVMERAEEIRS